MIQVAVESPTFQRRKAITTGAILNLNILYPKNQAARSTGHETAIDSIAKQFCAP
jgi:hypothetical protein